MENINLNTIINNALQEEMYRIQYEYIATIESAKEKYENTKILLAKLFEDLGFVIDFTLSPISDEDAVGVNLMIDVQTLTLRFFRQESIASLKTKAGVFALVCPYRLMEELKMRWIERTSRPYSYTVLYETQGDLAFSTSNYEILLNYLRGTIAKEGIPS